LLCLGPAEGNLKEHTVPPWNGDSSLLLEGDADRCCSHREARQAHEVGMFKEAVSMETDQPMPSQGDRLTLPRRGGVTAWPTSY